MAQLKSSNTRVTNAVHQYTRLPSESQRKIVEISLWKRAERNKTKKPEQTRIVQMIEKLKNAEFITNHR